MTRLSETRAHLALPFLLLSLGACGSGSGGEAVVTLEVVRDTVGDTVVVRTVAGSAWGTDAHLEPELSIGELDGALEYILGDVVSLGVTSDGTLYLVDGQVPELRAYDADGTYLATLGGPGEGPGELKSPRGGLAVLSDDRIVVRDPANNRLQVFDRNGPTEAWPVVRGGFTSGSPLWWDRDDNVYVFVVLDLSADYSDWTSALVRVGPDGTPTDTLPNPDVGFEAPVVEARGERVAISDGVPYAPAEETAFHPGGYYVHGISDRYAIHLLKDQHPLRIERLSEPVPVASAERSALRWDMEQTMRRVDSEWSWNGPPIPETKAPFDKILVGHDGRIWVKVAQPSIEEDNPDYDPQEEGSRPTRWREPVVFDVFGEDGTYFGRVRTPEDFSMRPTPFIQGDRVWAVTRDELGVQRVVRFRIVMDGAAAEG